MVSVSSEKIGIGEVERGSQKGEPVENEYLHSIT
jgi:hypothetical protein